MRTAVAESDSLLARRIPDDTDRLAASLHGRRSRMAEDGRLTDLCRSRSLAELTHARFPESDAERITDFQRLSVRELTRELSGFVAHLSGPAARLLHWMLVRFQVENLKVLIRARSSKGDTTGCLVPLPDELALDVQGLSTAESLDDFIRLAPAGLLRKSLTRTVEIYGDHPRPFFFEAVLDHDYLRELLARVERLQGRDREIVKPMARQEADIFHLMLVVRGKFHYGLTRETLLPLRVPGTRIPGNLFAEMLNDQDLRTVVGRVAELVFDRDPFDTAINERAPAAAVDVAALEHLAWRRFFRLANSAFRRSHMGLAAVVGYVAIRRVEVANLITLSEGLRKGMPAETIRARMVTYRDDEAAHV